jgi:DNA repair photolyase
MQREIPLPELGRHERTTRMLYKSGLGFFCITHVKGCSHGCLYPCHAFMLASRYGRVSDYAAWCRPSIVGNALPLLERELRHKRTRIPSVHLSLTTDPFMVGYPEVRSLTLSIVELLNRYRIPCSLLTKGALPIALADRTRFSAENTHGISLVSLDEGFRRRWEPGAAPYADRIAALKALHDAGRRTLVHIEPYPTPNILSQDVTVLLEAVSFVDHVHFSRWNYNAKVIAYSDAERFYEEQAAVVRRFCEHRHIDCDAE